ncbi:MAG: AAA family ATPase [Fusobacteriaceae bacterium]|nr:AAA family ATPase [Fusobacteriaceae bacterium]
MKKLIILIGNIGSGKTTFIKSQRLVKKGYVVIARDRLRYAIGGGDYIFNVDYEPIIWQTALELFEKFLKLGVKIVVDEVGITKLIRKRYIFLAKKYKYKTIGIEMPRFSKRKSVNHRMKNPHGQFDRRLWERVWDKFNKVYEKPTKSESFSQLFRL